MAIQDKFNKSNVIYKITKDIDLGGGTLTIPEGCTLDFQGGSFSNGTIKGNLNILGSKKIFNNITFLRPTTFSNIQPEWFGAKGDGINNDGEALQTMFLSLYSCLPTINFSSYYPLAPDFRNINIIFSRLYYTSSPIYLPEHFGLVIEGLKLKALTSFNVPTESPALTAVLNVRGGSLNLTLSNCILDGNYVADGLNLKYYAVDTNISKCLIRRFKQYGICGEENAYELKISDSKIVQVDSGSTIPVTTGVGLYMTNQKNDNHYNNLIIANCLTCSFKVLGGTNSFNNCHFWSGNKYSESGSYNTFNACYFDGEGLIIGGANTITESFFSSSVDDENYKFIKLNDITALKWLHEFTYISGTLFRNNSTTTMYSYPVGTIDDSSIDNINFTITGNRFFKVSAYNKVSPNYGEAPQIKQDIRGIGNGNESILIGALLIQYGQKTSTDEGSITFNIPYKNGYSLLLSGYNNGSEPNKLNPYNKTNNGFSVSTSCFWTAIGYSN